MNQPRTPLFEARPPLFLWSAGFSCVTWALALTREEPRPLALAACVLTTGPPGSSCALLLELLYWSLTHICRSFPFSATQHSRFLCSQLCLSLPKETLSPLPGPPSRPASRPWRHWLLSVLGPPPLTSAVSGARCRCSCWLRVTRGLIVVRVFPSTPGLLTVSVCNGCWILNFLLLWDDHMVFIFDFTDVGLCSISFWI